MKKALCLLTLMILSAILITPAAAQSDPNTTIDFVNAPRGGIVELGVGQTYTIEVQVTSDQPFNHAQIGLAPYYPGRGISIEGIQIAHQGTTATLHITITGKGPTAKLPDGVNPVTLAVGVRYQGGVLVSQTFDFGVVVK